MILQLYLFKNKDFCGYKIFLWLANVSHVLYLGQFFLITCGFKLFRFVVCIKRTIYKYFVRFNLTSIVINHLWNYSNTVLHVILTKTFVSEMICKANSSNNIQYSWYFHMWSKITPLCCVFKDKPQVIVYSIIVYPFKLWVIYKTIWTRSYHSRCFLCWSGDDSMDK